MTTAQERALAARQAKQHKRMIAVVAPLLARRLVEWVKDQADGIAERHQDRTGEDIGTDSCGSLGLDEDDVRDLLNAAVERLEEEG